MTIPIDERDPNLSEKLRKEWPIVLRWCIEGCLEWQAQGLNPPDVVKAATNNYLSDEDAIGLWLQERCIVAPERSSDFADLWTSWSAWAEKAGERPGSKKRLGQALQDRHFEPQRVRNGRYYVGLEPIAGLP